MRSSSKKARTDYEELSPEGGFKIRTYRPTLQQMKDFSGYIRYIHEDGGHRAGLAKIIPPVGYQPRKKGYADDELYAMNITKPIRQEVSGEKGLYQQFNVEYKNKISVRDFKRKAEEDHPTPVHKTHDELERIFWKNIFTNPSIYGADVSGSLYDDDVEEFNLTRLNTILDNIGQDYGVTIQGVNTAYLYFGMWKSSFCWHTEDMDLYSINYLHAGEPKSWYCIAPEHGKRFERLAQSFFPYSFKSCRAFLRHKTTLISPQVLKKYSIPYSKITQSRGEFMITFPFSYHSGYNHGFNIAEATNFALEYWIDFGKWATRCECRDESVQISMQTFVKRYQADRYENWLKGKDVCRDPRDPKHVAAAPKPSEIDLFLIGSHEKEASDEENREISLLEQNQHSNLEAKTKPPRKAYPSLIETYHRYNDLFLQNSTKESPLQLPHYSPIPTQMEPINHLADNQQTNHTDRAIISQISQDPILLTTLASQSHIVSNFSDKPNYDQQVKDALKLERKSKKEQEQKERKEEKARLKKDKKPKEHIIPPSMLQFMPVTFTHEKRFNRCIAALPPHCAVCQLLELHPKNNEDIWGPIGNKRPSTTLEDDTEQNSNDNQKSNSQATVDDCESTSGLTPAPSQSSAYLAGPQVEKFKLPQSSPILLPRGAFDIDPSLKNIDDLASNESEMQGGDSGYVADDRLAFLDLNLESSELFQCSVCMLCVHKACYGIDSSQDKSSWICDRCREKNRSIINCSLCPCRGGALKEVDKECWVHITCALNVSGVFLLDLIKRTKNVKSKLKLAEQDKNSCIFCATSLSRYALGKKLQCQADFKDTKLKKTKRCSNYFHATCGHRNGAKFVFDNRYLDPESLNPILAFCESCYTAIENPTSSPSDMDQDDGQLKVDSIPVGTRVVARAHNDLYYDAVVTSHQKVVCFTVYFPDYSETESGIESSRVSGHESLKRYVIGDAVEVIEPDGEVRRGKYKNHYEIEEYAVRFEMKEDAQEAGIEKLERKHIFLNTDQMPEDILEKYRGLLPGRLITASAQNLAEDQDTSRTAVQAMQLQ